jgi:hypothetical protein
MAVISRTKRSSNSHVGIVIVVAVRPSEGISVDPKENIDKTGREGEL